MEQVKVNAKDEAHKMKPRKKLRFESTSRKHEELKEKDLVELTCRETGGAHPRTEVQDIGPRLGYASRDLDSDDSDE